MREFVKTFGIIMLMFVGVFFYGEVKQKLFEYIATIEVKTPELYVIQPVGEVLNEYIGEEYGEVVAISSISHFEAPISAFTYTVSYIAIVEPIRTDFIVEEQEEDLIV